MGRSYTELLTYTTIEDRYRYLKIGQAVGECTFGGSRYLNQKFYRSEQWRQLRHHVIVRDNGCDLGIPGFELYQAPHIHHINPMSTADLIHGNEDILDPEFLITCSQRTHNAIHYGDESSLPRSFAARQPGDTKLW